MSDLNVLSIDAGQTGMKVRVHLRTGAPVADLEFPGIRTHEPLLPQLADVVHATLARTGASPDIVTAGISGLTDRDADADALLAMLRGTRIERAALAHDSTTSFLGALGDSRGAVVAAGTGVVTLAVGRESVARVDGWGYIMGDAGSGWWIGREALDAVMRAYDGRGPQTGLTDVVRERWPDLAQAYIALQAAGDRVSTVASFSADVARLAETGDAVARTITRDAATQLAHSAITAIGRVAQPGDDRPSVCAIGGVFRSPLLLADFGAALDAGDLAVTLIPPLGAGIDGTIALAELAPSHPLSSAVYRSSAPSV